MADRYSDLSSEFEGSESDSCGSSCSQSDNSFSFLPWLEKVGSKGDLFYIEQDIPRHAEKTFLNIVPDSDLSHQIYSKSKGSNLTAAEKFKKWMRKRKHKVRKPFLLLKSSKYNENINTDALVNPLSFTSKDIYVEVNTFRQTLGRKVTLAGELLGLELGSLEEANTSYMTDKIKIVGFTSGQEIPDVRIGDWLHSINDENVYLSNIDEILWKLELPTKVKLTILSPSLESSGFDNLYSKHSHITDELLGSCDVIEETRSLFLKAPYGVFLLRMLDASTEESEMNESLLYKYPDENSALLLLKGMFITLSHVIADVASPPILSCSLTVKGQTVLVGFLKEQNSILLLAVPAACATGKEIQYFVKNIAKLLKYQFSSLENAFSSEKQKKQMDKVFAMFFKYFLSEQCENINFSQPHLFEILPSAHWLPLPIELKTEIDEILNELESSDFGSYSPGFYENQRIYSILGSCLFYKGYLLSSHLQKNDFLDLHLFLQYNHILTLTKVQAVSELIIWKEVFPSRFQEKHHQSFEFEEVQGRYFLLVIAMNHSILSILLEAGGCAILAEAYPSPEPFYVEEVQNTLIILHNYGITSAVEKTLYFCLPPLASPDAFLTGDSNSQNVQSPVLSTANNSTTAAVRTAQCSSSFSTVSCDKGPADGDSDIDSDYSNTSNENSSFLSKKSKNLSMTSGSSLEAHGSSEYLHHSCQLKMDFTNIPEQITSNSTFGNTLHFSVGSRNSVFQYLHMDPVEGIFLAPIHEECSLRQGSAYSDILLNFHRCCMNMRSVFARSLRNKEILNSNTVTKFGVNNFLCSAYEQGVLYCYTDKNKQKSSLNFWIIGRLFFSPEPREVYVCYHDSTQQDIVEMAFRLGFGLSL